MFRKFIAAFVTILFAASIHTTAFAGGGVDWERGVIRATGFGAGPKNWDKNDSFYKTFARQAARIDALRQLVEMLEGVTVESDVPLSELFSTDSRVVTHFSREGKAFKLLEKNARVVNVEFLKDGICEVTMEVVIPADWKN